MIAPTLPAAVVTDPNYVAGLTGSSPTLVQDPINPQHLVEVNTTGSLVQAVYSTDGGTTWGNLLNANGTNLQNIPDPNLNANPGGNARYAAVNAPSAAIDRNETLYITFVEENATGTSGALVLQRFSFTGAKPTAVTGGTNQILDQWFGADPVLNPVVGVDDNLSSFTDTTATTNNVQTDTMSNKAVYIAWSTANTAPVPVLANFNANVIKAIASADGGKTFTTPQFVNNGGNISLPNPANSHFTSPKILFTQGSADGRVAGGQLVFVFDDFGNNTIDVDASKPDGGVAANQAAGVAITAGTTGPFGDAVAGTGGNPDTPTVTTFTAAVNITDANFILSDLDVSLSILAPHLDQLAVDLVAPNGTIVHLLENQIDGTGAVINPTNPPGVADQANLGELNGFLIGTDFDDGAARNITDVGATAPYTADFRPEAGSLSVFNGKTAAQLKGTWKLVVTDVLSDGMTAPKQSVDAWSLHMSSYISNTGFGTDQRVLLINATAPGAAQAPFPTVTPLSGAQGIGQGLSVAIDNTLGAFSPFEGRLYIAYNVGGGVRVASFDSLTPTSAIGNGSVNPADNTAGSRFDPTIAVDQTTGTVGVMYYDSNWDNLQVRSAMSFADSVDGGVDWSPSAQFNQLKTATDAITGATIVIEPYAGNQGIAGPLGFGDQSGLVMFAGHVVPMFASNNNTAVSDIATATVTIAAGPRILEGDMGSVIADFVDSDDKPNIVTYNNTFASDGTRQITGIQIDFDRPVDVSTFDATQFKLVYRDTVTPTSQPGTIIPNTDYTVVPIDNDDQFGLLPVSTVGRLAEEFLITFLPGDALSKVGTYSYAVGNIPGSDEQIRDMIKTESGAAASIVAGTATIAASPTGATETGTTVTITTSAPDGLVVGEKVAIAGVGVAGYNGTFTIVSTPTPTTFTYVAAAGLAASGGGNVTVLTTQTATIAASPNGATEVGTTVTITTSAPNGLAVGDKVTIAGVGVAGYNGTFTIVSTPSPTTFTYVGASAGFAASGGGTVTAIVPSIVETTESATIAATPTGATEVGNIVTITTSAAHGLAVGVTVTIAGVGVAGYNGTFVIASIPSPTTFTYVSPTTGLGASGGGTATINIVTVTTAAPHGFAVGATVEISGAGVAGYNGIYTILSVPSATSFTYSLPTSALAASGGGSVILTTLGNFVDQNQNTITDEPSSSTTLGDVFAIPTPTAGGPFVLPYDASTLPLIIPGPYIISTSVVGQPASPDNLVLNGTNDSIDVTFDRDMMPNALNNTNILRMVGPAGTIPFYTNNTPAPIPDGSGSLTSTITVTDSLAINDLAVGINITHANVAELSVTLVAPDGTTISLYAGTGAGANLTNTIFDSFSTTPITAAPGAAPYTAVFRPAGGSLSVLNGKNYQGTWKLIVTDKKSGNAGTLNSWSLNPYTVTPNPLGGVKNRTFRITFGGQSLSGTYTIVMGPNSAGQYGTDTNGNQIDVNHNAGLDVLRGGDPDNGTALLNTYTTGTLNTPIPAGSTVNIPINVTDSFLVQNVTLALTIQHKSDPDLTATLIAPDGFSVEIFTAVGKTTDANFTNTTLSDDALDSPIESAAGIGALGIGAGPYAPLNPLSAFKNHGSEGTWILSIQSKSSTIVGKLVNWTLNLTSSVPGSGLGEPVADQAQVSFRIFTQDPTNAISDQSWTAVGPASIDSGERSGSVSAIAVDPSDPSGNTVYVGGGTGGVWKTSNFMTTDAQGPTYVPLTDLGPSGAINIDSIAIFARNGDPNQSIIYALTGTGFDKTDTGTPPLGTGVGLLRSEDGGTTWHVLDSTDNVDSSGNLLPISSPLRDHLFVGTTGFKVIVDPTPEADGDVIVYMALSGPNGGIYRSLDSGNTWQLLQAGNATDVILGAGSADASGQLQVLYGAIEGAATFIGGGTGAPSVGGVYFSSNAPTAASMSILAGGNGDGERINTITASPTPILNDALSPNGNNGRIALATPVKTGNPLQDTFYQGWIYAAVASGPGVGLYMSKDYGLNWTLIPVPTGAPPITYANDGYMTLQVDPNNPSVVYYGGNSGYLRIDVTKLADAYAFVYYDQGNLPGPLSQPAGVSIGLPPKIFTSYFNFEIDPINRFVTPASYQIAGGINPPAPTAFNNTGVGAVSTGFGGGGLDGTAQLAIVAIVDPLSGQTRVIFGDDMGIWTGTDSGDGTPITNIGADQEILGTRNGNLQIALFNDGSAQPSTLAAEMGGALFYGMTSSIGYPQSDPNIINNGDLNWVRPLPPSPPNPPTLAVDGPGYGVAVDPTGSGTTYFYEDPTASLPLPNDFFSVQVPGSIEVSRTTGLLQSGDNPAAGAGQWPIMDGFEFTVNPVDPSAILMSSSTGRVFLTSGPTNGFGKRWFPIANPTDLDGTHASALAFGAPAVGSTSVDTFLYAGTEGGKVFVTFTGGGVGVPWKNISTGLTGGPVEQIIPSPTRGSHALYAITEGGVFFMADSSIAAPVWVNITGNLLGTALTRTLFNDPNQVESTDQIVTSLQVDWRYAIPDNLANPTGPTHPVLYVGTDGGVYRSLDKGTTWTYFPDQTIDGARQEGGYLPTVPITALTLSTGDINPSSGAVVNQANGLNMLVATTSGRGTFAIRIDDSILLANGMPLSTYAVNPVSGPHVTGLTPSTAQITEYASTATATSQFTSTDWSAMQATGAPDTGAYGDRSTAWAPLEPNSTVPEVLTVNYTTPLFADGVDIRETNGNGFVTEVDAIDTNGVTHVVWTGTDPSLPGSPVDFNVTFPQTTYLVQSLNIVVNTDHDLSTWEEIDSVQIQGDAGALPGVRVAFSGPVDPATFTAADVISVTDPNGNPMAVSSVVDVNAGATVDPHNVYDILFAVPPTVPGFYTVNFGPQLSDFSGNLMNQNQDATNGQAGNSPTGDAFVGRVLLQPWTNHAPVLNTTTATVPAVAPNTPAASITGISVFNFIQSLTPSPGITDPDNLPNAGPPANAGWAPEVAPLGIAVTGVDNTNGTWQYSLDGVTWLAFVVASDGSARLLQGSANGAATPERIRFVPNAGFTGTATFTFRAWDLTSGLDPVTGADGGIGNASLNGGSTAYSSTFATASLVVGTVNQAPTFVAGPTVTVLENAGPAVIPGWAKSISPGPPNESSQTVNFIVTGNTNAALFSTLPAISPNGTLTFVAAPNANGSATITIVLKDNGGTLSGGMDTSPSVSFTINVTPVNQAPSFTKGLNEMVLENSGPSSFANWATNLSTGPANESTQSFVKFIATNNNNALFSTQPSVDLSGTLTFTPAPNVFGTATVSVRLQDNGGTANGGVDTSVVQTFVIAILPVNQAPSFTAGPTETVLEDAGPRTFPAWATGISAGPPSESTQSLNFMVTNNTNPTMFTVAPAVSANGTLTFTPAANANGTATITLEIHDSGGTGNGGVDTSATQTFVINVTAVNDAPSFVKGPDQNLVVGATAQTVTGWATSISAGPPDESSQTVAFTVTNSNNALFSVQPSISPTGDLTYTPAPGVIGTATVSVTLKDNGGTANGGVDTSAAQTFIIALRDGTATALAANPTAPLYGQAITLTATVTPSVGSASALAGLTVTFFDGGTSLGTGLVNASGVATFATSTTTPPLPGTHNFVAMFAGSSMYNISSSPMTPVSIPQVVTTATVTSSINPSGLLLPVTFTATVVPAANGSVTALAGQTVTITVDGTPNTATLDATGKATLTTSALPLGNHNVSVSYAGSVLNMPSSSSTLVQVVQPGTFAALNSSNNPSHPGDTVTFTATLTSPGGAVPISSLAGQTVLFKDGTTVIGTGTLDATGVATFSTNSLATGPHAITAVYAGTSSVVGSTSVVLTQSVLIPSSVSVATSNASVPESTAVTFTATVSGTPGTPTGTVTFLANGAVIGSAPIGGGQAAFTTSSLAIGTYTITAQYSGDFSFSASSSTVSVTQTITKSRLV